MNQRGLRRGGRLVAPWLVALLVLGALVLTVRGGALRGLGADCVERWNRWPTVR